MFSLSIYILSVKEKNKKSRRRRWRRIGNMGLVILAVLGYYSMVKKGVRRNFGVCHPMMSENY
jgi:hypothetical protein